jgi:signal peptidase I
VAVVPFLLYLLWKKSILRTFFIKPAVTFFYKISYSWKNNKIETRVNEEIEGIVGKKIEIKDLFKYGFYVANFAFVLLVLKKTFYISLVVSQSMAPTLLASDLVLVESLTTENLEAGDIVVFTPPDQAASSVVHRIVSIDGAGNIKTQGDNAGIDAWTLRQEHIEGKVVTYKDGPITIKNFGDYLMPRSRTYRAGEDLVYEGIKGMINWIHNNGAMVLIFLMLIILITSLEGGKKYRAMYE